jgi:hypothetical protein
MHPLHFEYIKRHPFNDFAELFRLIDGLDPKKRDEAMMDTFCQFVKMRREGLAALRAARDPWGGIWDDYVNYRRFKEECLALPPNLNENFMVMSIVSYTLSIRFGWAELDKEIMVTALSRYAEKMSELMKNPEAEKELGEWPRQIIASTENRIANIDNEIEHAKELYAYTCEHLARPLLESWKRRLQVHESAGE